MTNSNTVTETGKIPCRRALLCWRGLPSAEGLAVVSVENAHRERVERFSNDFKIGGPVVDPTSATGVSGMALNEQPRLSKHLQVQAHAVSRHVQSFHQLGGSDFAVGDHQAQECDSCRSHAEDEARVASGVIRLGCQEVHFPEYKSKVQCTMQTEGITKGAEA